MTIVEEIKNYKPYNEQEKNDQQVMIQFIENHSDYLERSNKIGHFTVSIWTVNKERTKTLMVYHNIYQSWSWIGGHADGDSDFRRVALKELQEETGIQHAKLVCDDIFSLEVLTVDGHIKNGCYVPSHLHLNITFLAEADEEESLIVNRKENQAVKWWSYDDALKASSEPWFVKWIYNKLIEKSKCKGPY